MPTPAFELLDPIPLFLHSCLLHGRRPQSLTDWLTKAPSEFTALAPEKKKARILQVLESDESQDMEEGMLNFNKKNVMLDSGVGGGDIPPANGNPEMETQIKRVALPKKPLQQWHSLRVSYCSQHFIREGCRTHRLMLIVRQRHTGLITRRNLGKTTLAPEHACHFTAWAPVGQHLAVPGGTMFPSLSWLCRGKHLLANQVMVGTTPHPVLGSNCVFLTLCLTWNDLFCLKEVDGPVRWLRGGDGVIVYAAKSGYQSSVPRHTWWKLRTNSQVLSFDLHMHVSIFTHKISKTFKT